MQFYTIVAIFAASALAAPAADLKEARSIISDIGNALDPGSSSSSSAAPAANGSSCSLVQCAAALGPAAVGCGAAAAQALVDPISDVACLAAALNDVANKPAECDGCASKL